MLRGGNSRPAAYPKCGAVHRVSVTLGRYRSKDSLRGLPPQRSLPNTTRPGKVSLAGPAFFPHAVDTWAFRPPCMPKILHTPKPPLRPKQDPLHRYFSKIRITASWSSVESSISKKYTKNRGGIPSDRNTPS